MTKSSTTKTFSTVRRNNDNDIMQSIIRVDTKNVFPVSPNDRHHTTRTSRQRRGNIQKNIRKSFTIAIIMETFLAIGVLSFNRNMLSKFHRSIALHMQRIPKESLFSQSVYDSIQNGQIAMIPEFLSQHDVTTYRNDAQSIYTDGYFTSDALASYGNERNTKFDPSKDRTVLKLQQWKNPTIGNYNLRTNQLGNRISNIRNDLSYQLNRPHLIDKDSYSTSRYGVGSTEISYTRFGPGAYLKRHVDEHHEELKGVNGWIQPSRRSLSWLIYLNDPKTWNINQNNGCLRCYERSTTPPSNIVGSRSNGDLQIGWLHPTWYDPIERPVFLDSQYNHHHNENNKESSNIFDFKCAMYIDDDTTTTTNDYRNEENIQQQPKKNKIYITKGFPSHPTLYMTGSEYVVKKFFINNNNNNNDFSNRFQLIEQPRSQINDFISRLVASDNNNEQQYETVKDIPPLGGTLVIFDSVTLPHEVLPSIGKERWAISGWMHEDQQSIPSS